MNTNLEFTDSTENNKKAKKKRLIKPRLANDELVRLFWLAPPDAYFDQLTIAPVTGHTPKSLESYRWEQLLNSHPLEATAFI